MRASIPIASLVRPVEVSMKTIVAVDCNTTLFLRVAYRLLVEYSYR